MRAAEALDRLAALIAAGETAAELVVLSSSDPGVAEGERALVGPAGMEGTLGAPELDERAEEIGRAAIASDQASTTDIALEEGSCTLFAQPQRAADELIIVGAGHIARPLCEAGAILGYRMVVLDDRSGFATVERFPRAERVLRVDFTDPFRDLRLTRRSALVLVTRGHRYDYEALRIALALPEPPGYIGMVGSRRRVRATLEQLVREGIARERLSLLHAPIGLDVGAQTPEEIAIAIAAELVLTRRGGTGAPMREHARVLERWFREVE